jgi:hypothetical protein
MQTTKVFGAGGSVGTSVATSVATVPGVTSVFGPQAAKIMLTAIKRPNTIIVRLRDISFLLLMEWEQNVNNTTESYQGSPPLQEIWDETEKLPRIL